jgi:shikimate kinase
MKAIAFIGMPGSGKSTVADMTAAALGLPFVDTDARIEAFYGTSIAEVFATFGEAHFRAAECETVEDLVTVENLVISLGGGAVLQNENVISGNCTVVYLTRSIENIFQTLQIQAGQRPLAKSEDDLQRTLELRGAIYGRMADIVANNDGNINETVNFIVKELQKCGY